jgi:hypothetical protein
MTYIKKHNNRVKENVHWQVLIDKDNPPNLGGGIVDSGQVISIDEFFMWRNIDNQGNKDWFGLEIWKLTSSDVAINISNGFENWKNQPANIKYPRVLFIHRNYIVILLVNSSDKQNIILRERCKIEECFESSQVKIFNTIYPLKY